MTTSHGFIYLVTNTVNGKRYVGQTRNSVAWRWKGHVFFAKNGRCDFALSRAIRKYGTSNFTVQAIIRCSLDYLNYFEQRAIEKLNTMAPVGYNLTSGGDSGGICSLETREKMSKSNRERMQDPAYRVRLSVAHLGEKKSVESRAKMSAAKRGRPAHPNSAAGARAALLGKSLSAERRAKLSIPVTVNGKAFPSMQAAAIGLGVSSATVWRHTRLNGAHSTVLLQVKDVRKKMSQGSI